MEWSTILDNTPDFKTHAKWPHSEVCIEKMKKSIQLTFDIDEECNKLNENYKKYNINLLDFLENSKFKKTYWRRIQYIENWFCFYLSRTPRSILHWWRRKTDNKIEDNDSEDIINMESDTYISVFSYVIQFIKNINVALEKEAQKSSVNALKDSLLK